MDVRSNRARSFSRDSEGTPWGAFCINLDITPFVGLVNQLNSTLLRVNETDVVETFSDDVEVTVRNWVAEALFEIGKPLDALTRVDRLRLVQILDRKGLFQIKRAIPHPGKISSCLAVHHLCLFERAPRWNQTVRCRKCLIQFRCGIPGLHRNPIHLPH